MVDLAHVIETTINHTEEIHFAQLQEIRDFGQPCGIKRVLAAVSRPEARHEFADETLWIVDPRHQHVKHDHRDVVDVPAIHAVVKVEQRDLPGIIHEEVARVRVLMDQPVGLGVTGQRVEMRFDLTEPFQCARL